METIALFTAECDTALLDKLGDTQRSPADRAETYCARRRSSEQLTDFTSAREKAEGGGVEGGGMVGGREEKKITSNIQGQQPSFKSHLNKVRFLSPL